MQVLVELPVEHLKYSSQILVIQAGSAVTVDQVTLQRGAPERLRFEGGAIVPGIPMMLRLMGRSADLLPEIAADNLVDMPVLPGKDTRQAMLCGAASALVGGTLHLVSRYRKALGKEVPVILSGGDGPRLAASIEPPILVKEDLVLHGLANVAQDIAMH